MKEIILVKYGELALKGQNKRTFEDLLIKNIRRKLCPLGDFKIESAQSTIYIDPGSNETDLDEAAERLKKVFGIAALCRACTAPKDFEEIKKITADSLKETLSAAKTFKVEAKRSDKSFPLKSPEICALMGEHLLNEFPNLSVDVISPEITVTVEIRDFGAYIRQNQMKGAGGMPVGTGGKAAVLISGGIDSPVAAYMMAKRGIELTAVHFASPPYTSERAELKVKNLLMKVSEYSGKIKLIIIPFTKIQEEIRKNCPEDLFTLIMRRYMMNIAETIAKECECDALITGESLGQVASQTLKAIVCTDNVVDMPVFRPLIGMDKSEIVKISREIETFDISILPYEDCCTVFTPRHPRTKPQMSMLINAENNIDFDQLKTFALSQKRVEIIG